MGELKPHKRVNDILLGPLERPALQWLAGRMPPWMNPDILTVIGIIGSLMIFAGYGLSHYASGWLWFASLGFVVNWFGDSLDGTLARYRHIERPKYGFFVDHTVDAMSECLIVCGLGLSPFVHFDIAMLALMGYLLISVLVYVRTYVEGVFKISYGKLGPTEVRVILISVNTLLFFLGTPIVKLPFATIHVGDWIMGGLALILVSIFLFSSISDAVRLARIGE